MRLAERGMKVAINYCGSHDKAEQVKSAIVERGGIAELFKADVTDERQVASMHQHIEQTLGPIDVLVVNATGPQPDKDIEHLSWQDMLDQLNFFVKSPLLLVQQVMPSMKERGQGRIINIGSEVFALGAKGCSAYVAAKGAQLGLVRSWARELGPFGITINMVAPGWIAIEEREHKVPEPNKEKYIDGVPMKCRGLPEDIAAAVAFLASEDARFITGQCLAVNGGNTFS